MANDVVFHALETTSLTLGNGVGYGPRALVHGGRQVVNGVANGPETSIGDKVGLGQTLLYSAQLSAKISSWTKKRSLQFYIGSQNPCPF